MEVLIIKIAGVVILFYPSNQELKNIDTYLEDIKKLYVVDNTPNKRYDAKLPKSKKIEYIHNGENLGVAAALNIGARRAIYEGYTWLLTMDQDSYFHLNDLKKMKNYIVNNVTNDIGIISPWHETKLNILKPSENIDYPMDVMTSGNIVNLEIYKIIGGYKDWLFIDAIDIEYCLNLWSNGFKVVRLNYVEVIHNLGDIFEKNWFGIEIVCINHNHLRRYYIMRNNLYIRDMYIEYYHEYCKNLVNQKSNLVKIILFEKDKYRKIRESIRGYFDYKRGIKNKYRYKN